jgi:hypothetical protein
MWQHPSEQALRGAVAITCGLINMPHVVEAPKSKQYLSFDDAAGATKDAWMIVQFVCLSSHGESMRAS